MIIFSPVKNRFSSFIPSRIIVTRTIVTHMLTSVMRSPGDGYFMFDVALFIWLQTKQKEL